MNTNGSKCKYCNTQYYEIMSTCEICKTEIYLEKVEFECLDFDFDKLLNEDEEETIYSDKNLGDLLEGENISEDEDKNLNYIELIESLEQYIISLYESIEYAPMFSSEALFNAIVHANGSVEIAAQLLFHALDNLNNSKPCRHHLNGKCFRKDCQFEHDISKLPCFFWLLSSCIQTDCSFIHDIPASICEIYSAYGTYTMSWGEEDATTSQTVPPFDESEFPALPSTNNTNQHAISKKSINMLYTFS